MRSIVSARRRADEFEAGVETGTVSSSAPSETRALIDLVHQIRAIDTVETRADFATDLRTRLLAAAPAFLTLDETASATVPVSLHDRRRTPARRALSAAATACIVVGGGVGVAAASQTALPGESLYPVKRGIERIEVSTAGSPAGRGQEYLQQAENRLSEIEQLALTQPDDYTTPLLMRRALDDFSTAAQDGGDALMTAYREDGSDESISELRQFTGESSRRLEAMLPLLPGDLHDELVAAAESLSTLDSTARQLCPMCSTLGPLDLSSALTIVREPLGQLTGDPVVKPVTSPHVTPSGRHTPNAPGTPTPGQPGPDLPSVTIDLTAINRTAINPTAIDPTAVNPTAVIPPAIDPTAVNPSAVNPTAIDPTAVNPTAVIPPAIDPTAVNPGAVNPTAVNPGAVNPTAVNPGAVNPTAVNPGAVNPTAVNPTAINPSAVAVVTPPQAPPSAPAHPTTPPATQPTTAVTTPDVRLDVTPDVTAVTPALPRPPAGSNNQPGPSVPSVDVEDPLSTVPEVLDTTGDAVDPITDVVDPLLP